MSKKRITIRLDEEIIKFVEDYAKYYGITNTQALEIMISETKGKGKLIPKEDLVAYLVTTVSSIAKTLSKLVEKND